jgi:parallel beta-helix repeat protein
MEKLKSGGILLSILIILLGVIFFKITGNVTVIPSTSANNTNFCQVLNVSGQYLFNQSVINENYTLSPCFNITVSDVEINCAGYSIENITQGFSAIYAAYVNNVTIKNCVIKISNENGMAIYFEGVNDSFIRNNNLSYNSQGVYFFESNNVQISNNLFSGNSLGILLNKSKNNLLNSNTFDLNIAAIQVSDSSNNSLLNNVLRGCSSSRGCLIFEGASSNSFISGNVNSSNSAVHIVESASSASSNNFFKDAALNGNFADINVSSANNLNNSFINTTYNSSKEFIHVGSEIIKKWYYRLFVNSTRSSTGIANVNVTAYNSSNAVTISAITDSGGFIPIQILTSYISKGDRTYLGEYLVVASNISSSSNHSINLSSNLLEDYLVFNISAPSSNNLTNSTSSNSTSNSSSSSQTTQTTQPQNTPAQPTNTENTLNTAPTQTPQIVYLEQSQIEGGYIAELNTGEKIYFNLSGEFHSLTIDELVKNSENNTLSVTVASEPQKFSLIMGEQKKLDMDIDGYYDVLIGFNNISYNEKALILIMRINESVIKPAVEQANVTTTTETNSITFGFMGAIEKKVNSQIFGPVTLLHVIIVILVLCIFFIICIYKGVNKKKSLNKKK